MDEVGDPPAAPPEWRVWLALWTVYIVWGSTYLGIRVVVETAPPLISAGARFSTRAYIASSAAATRRSSRCSGPFA